MGCAESGQHSNVSEVVRARLRLLQGVEPQRAHLRRLVEEGYVSAMETGTVSAEAALGGIDEAIEAASAPA
jgi:putative addiction module CopG family antidote